MNADISKKIFEIFTEDFIDGVSKDKELESYLKGLEKQQISNSVSIYLLNCDEISSQDALDMAKETKPKLIDYTLDNIEDIYAKFVSCFDDFQIRQLEYIIRNDGYLEYDTANGGIPFEVSIGMMDILRSLNMAFLSICDDVLKVHMPKRSMELVANCLNNKEIHIERRDNIRLFEYCCGVLEAYGVVEFEYLYKLYNEQVAPITDIKMFRKLLCISRLEDNISIFEDNDEVMLGIDLEENIMNILKSRREKSVEYYKFSRKDFTDLKNEDYIRKFNSHKKLEKYFEEEWNVDKEYFELLHTEVLMDYLFSVQSDENVAVNRLRVALAESFEFDDIEQETEMINLIKDLRYDYPCWVLKGNKIPKVITLHRSNKIGRNELCPCGSGKKYKMCCGK